MRSLSLFPLLENQANLEKYAFVEVSHFNLQNLQDFRAFPELHF